MDVEPSDVTNRKEALAAFAAFVPDKWDHKSVVLPTELLGQIAIDDILYNVPVTVGAWYKELWHDPPRLGLAITWNGRLIRSADGVLLSVIHHDLHPILWDEPIGIGFFYDLLHKCVLNRVDTIECLTVDYFSINPNERFGLDYRFRVDGANLKEAYEKARRIQHDLEGPAEQVLNDMTRTLARSADRILGSHHAQISQLVALVEAAESPSDKGNALESLMAALFEQVPGFVVYDHKVRTETEEIDLVLLNDSRDPIYSRDGPLILVECKNWTTKPGRPDFSQLESKIRNRHNRCTVAFFVSWSGFADTTGRETIRTSRENYVIVCLAGSDVRRAALGGNFPEFLRHATIHTLNR